MMPWNLLHQRNCAITFKFSCRHFLGPWVEGRYLVKASLTLAQLIVLLPSESSWVRLAVLSALLSPRLPLEWLFKLCLQYSTTFLGQGFHIPSKQTNTQMVGVFTATTPYPAPAQLLYQLLFRCCVKTPGPEVGYRIRVYKSFEFQRKSP